MSNVIVKSLTRIHPSPLDKPAKVQRRYQKNGTLTTAQVAHLRWLFEKEGWAYERLNVEFGLDVKLLKKTMSYITRSYVLPKMADDVKAVFEAKEEAVIPKSIKVKETNWMRKETPLTWFDYRKRRHELCLIKSAIKEKYHGSK